MVKFTMMKREFQPFILVLVALCSVLAHPLITQADKFGDSLTQNEPLSPQAATIAPPPLKQPAFRNPAWTTVPDFSKIVFKTPADIKPVKISVPDYEDQFKEVLQSELKAKAKKKKLVEGVFDEMKKYGIYILLGLVGILVAYALHKDKIKPTDGSSDEDAQKKKDIWKEGF